MIKTVRKKHEIHARKPHTGLQDKAVLVLGPSLLGIRGEVALWKQRRTVEGGMKPRRCCARILAPPHELRNLRSNS